MSETSYDKIAEQYTAAVDAMPANQLYERPATLSLLPNLNSLDVLDAGCGHGFYTECAVNAGARVVAFDPSVEMVKHCKTRLGDRCQIYHAVTSELGSILQDTRFDVILSNLVLHYVDDLKTEFSHLSGFLKDDGMILVSMKHPLCHMGYVRQFGYRSRGRLELDWGWAGGKVVHIQRPLGEITEAIFQSGLVIEKLIEAAPLPEMKEKDPKGYGMAMAYPFFIHLVLRPRTLLCK